MNFLKNLFGKKEEPIKSNEEFWIWFKQNADSFFSDVKQYTNIEEGFFNRLSPKLEELKGGYCFLSGMFDDNTAELIITADGNLKNIALWKI